jgi:hypothetical protein
MYVNISKKSYSTTGSILATIQVLPSTITEDTAAFVVTQAYTGDPTAVNNIRFLSVASAADYQEYDVLPIVGGIYRTDKITVCIDTTAKYTTFITTLLEDLNKSALLSVMDFTAEESFTLEDTGSEDGPFFFGSVEA